MSKLNKRDREVLSGLKKQTKDALSVLYEARSAGKKARQGQGSGKENVFLIIDKAISQAISIRDVVVEYLESTHQSLESWVNKRSEKYWYSQRCSEFNQWSAKFRECADEISRATLKRHHLTVTGLKKFEESFKDFFKLPNEPDYQPEIKCYGGT